MSLRKTIEPLFIITPCHIDPIVSFSMETFTVSEGSVLTGTLSLDRDISEEVMVLVTSSDGTATGIDRNAISKINFLKQIATGHIVAVSFVIVFLTYFFFSW